MSEDDQLTRAEIRRMKPADLVEAYKQGRCDNALGRNDQEDQ